MLKCAQNLRYSLRSMLVSAKNLKKSYGDFEAVRGVDFSIQKGECFGLLGPNGAGKSTIINMIYGATPKSSGELHVFNRDSFDSARDNKKRLGVVTQDNALDESLTVFENMWIYSAFLGVPTDKRRARIDGLLEFLNLSHKRNANINALSGGMKRRLVFVRALLHDPELIILDEPTTGLDPAVRHLIWGKVRELRDQGKTILLTTHYMHEAEVLCDRLLIMNEGQIVAEGSPKLLCKTHAPGYVAAFDQKNVPLEFAPDGFSVARDSSGVYVRAPQLDDLLRLQFDLKAEALLLRPANLEDVFLKLTGQELNKNA